MEKNRNSYSVLVAKTFRKNTVEELGVVWRITLNIIPNKSG